MMLPGHPCHTISLLVALFLFVTSSSDFPDAVPDMRFPQAGALHGELTKRNADFSHETHADVRVPDPRLYSEKLAIFLVESATSWLDIRWQLQNKTGASVSVPQFSRVRCHIGNTTTVIHNIYGSQTRFRIPNLVSDTEYTVCVEVVEVLDMPERSLHYRCAPFSTIPVVRPDSVLGLLLTLGYVFVMGFIGYVTWCMRVRRHAASHKSADEMELSCRTSTVRCSEIEERWQLNSHQPRPSGKS